MNIGSWIKEHPFETGGLVFVAGAALLFLLRSGGGGGASSSDQASADAAYYQAQSASVQSGNALQAVQVQAQASTTQDLINASADVTNNNTWATTQLAETQSTNATATQLAPYQTEGQLISTLGSVASIPPTTVTNSYSTGGSPGFFGIGATPSKSVSTTSIVPNQAATDAATLLDQLAVPGFNAAS